MNFERVDAEVILMRGRLLAEQGDLAAADAAYRQADELGTRMPREPAARATAATPRRPGRCREWLPVAEDRGIRRASIRVANPGQHSLIIGSASAVAAGAAQ